MAIYEYDLKEILPRVVGPLRNILDCETVAGNLIVEVSSQWPMKVANVWLAKRFHQNYVAQFPMLQYEYLGDPKNWIEHYIDVERGLMVAVSVSIGI